MMDIPFLTIITPTYNRGHLLRSCYESLCVQTDKDFEWIIVDDGSRDDTEWVARDFSSDSFPVIYLKKENGGKHTALNAAHPHIRGKYVLILDSDDRLTTDAVCSVKDAWSRYQDDKNIGILTFLKGNSLDKPNCTVKDFGVPVDIMRYRRTHIYGSDCCEVIRAELFLQYPFPVFEGERFLSECALWNRVSFTHKCVYINQVIYLFEYLEGGLTQSGRGLRIRNPRGGMFISELRMDKRNSLGQRVKYGSLYTCYGFFANMHPVEMARMCRAKGLMWLCVLPGKLLYFYWKHKFGDTN